MLFIALQLNDNDEPMSIYGYDEMKKKMYAGLLKCNCPFYLFFFFFEKNALWNWSLECEARLNARNKFNDKEDRKPTISRLIWYILSISRNRNGIYLKRTFWHVDFMIKTSYLELKFNLIKCITYTVEIHTHLLFNLPSQK